MSRTALDVQGSPRTDGHLGPGIDDAHRPCRGQPQMSQVVLGQMNILDLELMMLIDHVEDNLRCPG